MRIYLDTEFWEHDNSIDLISLGAVREDGEEFYVEFQSFDWSRVPADHWIQENVKPHLYSQQQDKREGNLWIRDGGRGGFVSDQEFRSAFLTFVHNINGTYENPEFWTWYGDYDWVALCQKYGTMVDLPPGWPQHALDLRQEVERIGVVPKRPKDLGFTAHNALEDARWTFTIGEPILEMAGWK